MAWVQRIGGNPNTVLGINTELNETRFYEYAKKFMENGATILGGCCEIRLEDLKIKEDRKSVV